MLGAVSIIVLGKFMQLHLKGALCWAFSQGKCVKISALIETF